MNMLRFCLLFGFLLTFGVSTGLATMHLVPSGYSTIQEAIDASVDLDTVCVDPGVYPETIDFLGKDIVVTSLFAFSFDSSDIVNTVIDAEGNGSCVSMTAGETETAVLMGFTLMNGSGSYYVTPYGNFYVGGGIYLVGSSPTIQFNIIKENDTPDGGAGIFCDGGTPTIQYNVIVENITTALSGCGAGILLKNTGGGVIAHNYIQFNVAQHGGGIALKNADPEITRNVISHNTANLVCGGIRIYDGSNPVIINNTISHNCSMPGTGGGVEVQDGSAPVFMNNIVSYTACGGGFVIVGSGFPDLSYNLFWENLGGDYINCAPGIGDITGDPAFVGGDPHDYHLTALSAAIDAGNPDPAYNDPDGTRNDIGAFFYPQGPVTPVVLNAFTGSAGADGILISWNTASEIQCYGWMVQRRQGDELFEDVSPLILGYGTSEEPHSYSFLDQSANSGETYQYRLKQIDASGAVTYSGTVTVSCGSALATGYTLLQNYPNPFNPETVIAYNLPDAASVRMTVYNATGQLVSELISGFQEAGLHTITWRADNLPSGSYICRLEAGGRITTRLLTLLK